MKKLDLKMPTYKKINVLHMEKKWFIKSIEFKTENINLETTFFDFFLIIKLHEYKERVCFWLNHHLL